MDPNEAIFGRRSVREYTSQTVDDQTIQKLIDAAVYAPNAMHQQPWTFTIVRNRKMLDEISRDAKSYMLAKYDAERPGRANRVPAQRAGFSYLLPCTSPGRDLRSSAGVMDCRGLCARGREPHAIRLRPRARHLLGRFRTKLPEHTGREKAIRPSGGMDAGSTNHRWLPPRRPNRRSSQGSNSSAHRLTLPGRIVEF